MLLVAPAASGRAIAQEQALGSIRFPTSGAPEAETHFLRGLAALHSFWHREAVPAFREAQRLDRDFAMAYWGEALAHDGVWGTGHDAQSAREALRRLAATAAERRAKAPSEREKAYLDAIETLYGEGERFERARRYAEAMAALAARFPDDLEAKALLARALLATIDAWNFKDEATRVRAGAIAEEVLDTHPNHPGAAHYVIHAYDSPEHARRALPAARAYASIAPASSHAIHMPSHIYLQLGMWQDVVASNRRAFEISDRWVRERGQPITDRDYHALDFLYYAYLQQGRWRDARATLDSLRVPFEGTDRWSWAGPWYRSRLALYVVEAGRCDEIATPPADGTQHHAVTFALGWCAIERADLDAAERWHQKLARSIEMADAGTADRQRRLITERELAALIQAARGDGQRAEALAMDAVLERRKLGPQGELPNPILPVHELYGDVLLRLGRPARAAAQLDYALSIKPNRAVTILKRARAAARIGDDRAALQGYRRLLELWEGADPGLPPLQEAREYIIDRANQAGR